MPSRRLRISAAQRWRASSALTGDCRAAAWRRTPLFGVARCEITAGDMAGSIDRLTVGPRDLRRHGSFHRTAGIARRSCGVDLPARRVAGHCPGDETAAAVHLVDLALGLGRDRIGGINAILPAISPAVISHLATPNSGVRRHAAALQWPVSADDARQRWAALILSLLEGSSP